MKKRLFYGLAMVSSLVLSGPAVFAATERAAEAEAAGAAQHFGVVFMMFAVVLLAAKIGNFVEKFGQPGVIGELFAGIFLAALGYFGVQQIDAIVANEVISFMAAFGALLLLFSIGLESEITEMKKVGFAAAMVAVIGVVLPFAAGAFVLGPIFFREASVNAHLFLGASLVATSVGITASVFRSLGILRTRAARTVLGAAVIDDVLGLIVLAIVSALVSGTEVTGGTIFILSIKAFGFLAGALVLGTLLARPISNFFSKIYSGIGMKLGIAIAFALIFGYVAELFGLEPIIGAFAAGLLLDSVHFNSYADPEIVNDLRGLEFQEEKDRNKVLRLINKHKRTHVEDLIGNIGLIFVPIFFVYTGLQVDFESLLQPDLYIAAGIISIIAVITKLVSGFAAKGPMREKLLVGMAMVPRGEVGLIFAATGRSLGVLSSDMFSVIILVVIFTTFIAPQFIKKFAPAD